jgi:hypothetical protein
VRVREKVIGEIVDRGMSGFSSRRGNRVHADEPAALDTETLLNRLPVMLSIEVEADDAPCSPVARRPITPPPAR